jgi:hypothetical protein
MCPRGRHNPITHRQVLDRDFTPFGQNPCAGHIADGVYRHRTVAVVRSGALNAVRHEGCVQIGPAAAAAEAEAAASAAAETAAASASKEVAAPTATDAAFAAQAGAAAAAAAK